MVHFAKEKHSAAEKLHHSEEKTWFYVDHFYSNDEFVMIQVCQKQEKINCFRDKLHENNSLHVVGQPPEYDVVSLIRSNFLAVYIPGIFIKIILTVDYRIQCNKSPLCTCAKSRF